MTATTAKNTTNRAVKGRASSKAWPIWPSSMMPLSAVRNTITDRPMRPTAARWKARAMISQMPAMAWTISCSLPLKPRLASILTSVSSRCERMWPGSS